MDVGEERDPVDRFERALKVWAERPPRVSPEEASRRVLEAARRRRRRSLTRRALLAAVAALAVIAIPGILRERPRPEATPAAAAALEPRPLGANEALIWLDAQTPLYMTFEAPPVPRGGVR
jgi:ferric-dicitrate binding protein FerR (iron transport regulator)